jgi:iron complex transport system substrate-binding protein
VKGRRRIIIIGAALLAVLIVAVFALRERTSSQPEMPQIALPDAPTPTRIVSLAPSITEMLFALGVGEFVVAVDDYSDWPPQVQDIPRVGGIQVNYEAVLAHKPDVVVGVIDLQSATLERLDRMNVPVLGLDTAGYEKTIRAMRTLGLAVGASAQADALGQELRMARQEVSLRVRDLRRPTVLFVAEAEPGLYVAGRGTFIDEMIHLAGGRNAIDAQGFTSISRESLLRAEPQVVLVEGPQAEAAMRRRMAGATGEARIVQTPPDILVRPGPRLGDGLRWLADTLHPPGLDL